MHDLLPDLFTNFVISSVGVGMNDDRYEEITQGSPGRVDAQLSMLSRSRLMISSVSMKQVLNSSSVH